MISLQWPWVLVALPLPWLVWRWLPAAPRGIGRALRLPFYAEVAGLGTPHHGRPETNRGILALTTLAWVLLVLAAARPQWLGAPLELPVSGRDLMLAVDISGSMKLPDLDTGAEKQSRLAVVKTVADRFIHARQGDRLGLILFGTRAYLQTPLTFDRHTVAAMLDEAQIGMAGKNTAIGDAIGLAVKRLRHTPTQQRVLILLTDGVNNAGEVSPLQAAKLAATAKVRIYTVGLGADRMAVQGFFGTQIVNPSQDLDEATLKRIAKETGGRYFRARDQDALAQVYHQLDQLEPVERDHQTLRPRTALYMWPLGLALLLSLIPVLRRLPIRLPRRPGRNAGAAHQAVEETP